MRLFLRKLWLFLFFTMPILAQGQEHTSPDHDVSVAWNTGPRTGRVLVSNGRIKKIKITTGNGKLSQSHAFKLTHCPCTIAISFDSAGVAPGPGATIVSVDESKSAFSFFLRDVNADFPIYMPSRNVAVFPSSTGYGYKQIETLVASKKLKTKAQKTEEEPEVSFESVSKKVRNQTAPTWLGLSRDVRHFLIQDITASSRGEVSVISPLNKFESIQYTGKPSNYKRARASGARRSRSRAGGPLPARHEPCHPQIPASYPYKGVLGHRLIEGARCTFMVEISLSLGTERPALSTCRIRLFSFRGAVKGRASRGSRFSSAGRAHHS